MMQLYCFAALRSCEHCNRDFAAKRKVLATDKSEFTTYFAISQNRW